MRTFVFLTKSTLAVLATFGLTVASGRALPPISKEIKLDPKIKTTADANAVKHGMRVAVTLKDKKRVTGTVVWADPADDSLLIRERPGAVPRKIDGKNIAAIDRIRLTSASGTVMRDESEIFQVEEINGSLRTVKYFAPDLSPGEKSQLAETEIAENEAARMQYMQAQLRDAMQDQMQTLKHQASLVARQDEIMGIYATELSWLSSFSPFLSTPGLGGARGGFLPQGSPAAILTTGGTGGTSTVAALDSLIAKQTALEGTIAKARRNLTLARSRGLYEGGELVAVRPATSSVMPVADDDKER
jgi:hypothetical protein